MKALLTPEQIELLAGFLSFIFTVGILSYVLGDNPFYRLTLHIFIGVVVINFPISLGTNIQVN